MEFNFKGKRALVTGAGKGIGLDVAKALYAAGATTFALSRTQSDLDSLKSECPEMNTVCLDLSDWEATTKAVESIGAVDLLVNNAGVIASSSVLTVTKEEIDTIYSTNVKAVLNVTQVVAKGMIARKSGGAIVNVSSITSQHGFYDLVAYVTSKGALDQLTRCMAGEFGPHKIRVNSVHPTIVHTPMGAKATDVPTLSGPLMERNPLGRYADVNEITGPVLFLLSDSASMVNGVLMHIDGGYHST